ncbi:MAG TPA: hypothetical protein PLO78_06430 [Candidatus Omnitrophota bacterium]|nr:hypothetical protein [Candidatus Omnitrophota bacterium]
MLLEGRRCEAHALTDKDYCFSHDPDSKQAKAIACRTGGLMKTVRIPEQLDPVRIQSPKDVIKLLSVCIAEVRAGRIDCRTANTIAYLSSHLLQAFDRVELEEKIQELNAVLSHRQIGGGNGESFT